MHSLRMSQFSQSLLLLAATIGLSGCASMGGNMANSSGMSYYENGNYDAAAREFQIAMMNDPQNPDYHANFAKSRQKMGDLAGAEHHFRQALTIARDHQPSYHGLAEVFVAQGRGQEAQEMLTTWAATQPYQPDAHVELAWLQQEMGDPNAAAQSLQKALQINPNHSTALAHLGRQYEDMGRPDQAVEMYQNSLRSDWNQPDVHSRLAAASQKAGPSSAMAATAMGRGVHPYSVARQPSLMGPPSAGSQMAQMQIAQNQMAMSGMGNRMMSPNQNQFAMSPMMPGAMSGYSSPSMMGSTPQMQMMNPQMAMSPMNSGWHSSSPMMSSSAMPTTTASFDNNMFPVPTPPGSMTFPMETIIQSPPGSSLTLPTKSAAVPTPDPTFSQATTPVSTISLSQTAPMTTTPASSEPPVVEAF